MILRDRVGGGGNEQSDMTTTVAGGCALDKRPCFWWLDLTFGEDGDAGRYEESDLTEVVDEHLLLLAADMMAGGGRVNDISRDDIRAFSFPRMSVEVAGVGGKPVRGMMVGG